MNAQNPVDSQPQQLPRRLRTKAYFVFPIAIFIGLTVQGQRPETMGFIGTFILLSVGMVVGQAIAWVFVRTVNYVRLRREVKK